MLAAIRAAGHAPTTIHTDNSAAAFSAMTKRYASGSSPSKEDFLGSLTFAPDSRCMPGFPAFLSRNPRRRHVVRLGRGPGERVPAGTRIGYGGTFVLPAGDDRRRRAAGYADGVPRSLSEKDRSSSGGGTADRRRISMDLTASTPPTFPSRPPRRSGRLLRRAGRGTPWGRGGGRGGGTVSWRSSAASGRACHVSSFGAGFPSRLTRSSCDQTFRGGRPGRCSASSTPWGGSSSSRDRRSRARPPALRDPRDGPPGRHGSAPIRCRSSS